MEPDSDDKLVKKSNVKARNANTKSDVILFPTASLISFHKAMLKT